MKIQEIISIKDVVMENPADVIGRFRLLLEGTLTGTPDDIHTAGADLARQAVRLNVPLMHFIEAYQENAFAVSPTSDTREGMPEPGARLLSVILNGYDCALADYATYGTKLRNEVLERREVEKQLRETQNQLENHNERFSQELRLQTSFLVDQTKKQEKLLDRLRSKQREQADFTYAVSHDLKSPTNTVMMLLDLFQEECGERDTDLTLIHTAQKTIVRMQKMLDALLDLAQTIDAEPVYSGINLNDLLSDVMHDLQGQLVTSGAKIEVGPLPTVRGIEYQMRHLFQNLISNAVKFRKTNVTPEIAIRDISTTGSAITRIEVSDNGIGIAPAYHEKIFDLFSRLHIQEDYCGSGLGLTLCKTVAENHGGRILLTSQPDVGSTFQVALPR